LVLFVSLLLLKLPFSNGRFSYLAGELSILGPLELVQGLGPLLEQVCAIASIQTWRVFLPGFL